jgi:hypothetical protein
MQPANVQAFSIESLQGQLDARGLRLSGSLRTGTAQAELERHVSRIHDGIVASKSSDFVIDVRALSFVNSSCIHLFVNWIARAERAAYKLVFLTERSVTWHRLSFSVMKGLAPASVEVIDEHPIVGGGA